MSGKSHRNSIVNPFTGLSLKFRPVLSLLLLVALLGTSLLWFVSFSSASASEPVLGHRDYGPPPFGKGYGSVQPKTVFHGGSMAGYFFKLRWRGWGGPVATGAGRGYWYKPGGGYYKKPIRIWLRARNLNYCGVGGRLAYSVLEIKRQKKPGGGFFPWSSGLPICG